MNNTSLEFAAVDGIGVAATTSLDDWWAENSEMFYSLLEELQVEKPEEKKETVNTNGNSIVGMTFVITGSVNHFKNRNELQEKIEQLGGKVAGSVSVKTSVLINNDSESSSSKNIKAKSLSIPIWTEENFLKYIGE
jgi:DNA ligase (NAD+)